MNTDKLLLVTLFLVISPLSSACGQTVVSIGETGRFACRTAVQGSEVNTQLLKYTTNGSTKKVGFKKWLRRLRREIKKWRDKSRSSSNSKKKNKFQSNRQEAKADRKAVKQCKKSQSKGGGDTSLAAACSAFEGNLTTTGTLEFLRIVNGTVCSGPSTIVRLSLAGALCSGVHIGIGPSGDSWILTASHCMDGLTDPDQITIFALSSSGQIQRNALSFVQNPTWVGEFPEIEVNDYALVQVEGKLVGVPSMPPCTKKSASSIGDVQYIAGFGRANLSSGKLSVDGNLRAGVVIVDELTTDTIRATRTGGDKAVSTSCGGDSGGPITGIEGGNYCANGVVSWGTDSQCSASGNTDIAYWSNITSDDGKNFIAQFIGTLNPAS